MHNSGLSSFECTKKHATGLGVIKGWVPLRSAFYDSGKNAAVALSKKVHEFCPQLCPGLRLQTSF